MCFPSDYIKPVNKKILKKPVYHDQLLVSPQLTVEVAIGNFEEAAWQFTDRQYATLISNIISKRASKCGGPKLMRAIIKEIGNRTQAVSNQMLD